MAYKIDLHTHSIASRDGALTAADYRRILKNGMLDCIAVTDHNTTSFALQLAADPELKGKIIVGEEITTIQGEVIGLYLTHTIPGGLSLAETIRQIRRQNGLVYIPHPFETVRKGVMAKALAEIIADVDIIEVGNGRAVFQNRSELAKEWAVREQKAGAASSDSHGPSGWGRTYSVVPQMPRRQTLVPLLHEATFEVRWPGLRGILYPKFNRLSKQMGWRANPSASSQTVIGDDNNGMDGGADGGSGQ